MSWSPPKRKFYENLIPWRFLTDSNSKSKKDRNSHQRSAVEKGVPRSFTKFTKSNCARVSFLIKFRVLTFSFIKKETLAQVFSCEFCEISKKTFFTEHLRAISSEKIIRWIFTHVLSNKCYENVKCYRYMRKMKLSNRDIKHYQVIFAFLPPNSCKWGQNQLKFSLKTE